MGSSIQDYLKKINSRLSWLDCLSFLITFIFIVFLSFFIDIQEKKSFIPISYIKSTVTTVSGIETRPFASVNGKTYIYSWCQGSKRIKEENKIYFENEKSALLSGRTLSKLCKK